MAHDIEMEEQEENVYADGGAERLVSDDEIDPSEEAFVLGYNETEEDEDEEDEGDEAYERAFD